MIETAEDKKIPAPKNPLTIKLNQIVLGSYFDWFAGKYLPGFDLVVTSEVRNLETNSAAGGVSNSAHLHGLARDFYLKSKKTGATVPESEAKVIYAQSISPNWSGYSEWEPSIAGKKGYHIHVNLSRRVSEYTGVASLGIIGTVGVLAWSAMQNHSQA